MDNPLGTIDPARYGAELTAEVARLEALELTAVHTLAASITAWGNSGQLLPLSRLPWFAHRRHRFYGNLPDYFESASAVVRDDGRVFIWKSGTLLDSLRPWAGRPSSRWVAESLHDYARDVRHELNAQHKALRIRLNNVRTWNLNSR